MAQVIVFGIICEKKTDVSLLYATHNVSINGFTAHVNIEAEYINESQHKTEAKFVFPVEEDSAVYRFEAKIGDVHIVAKSKDKNVAQKEYKEAVEKGMSAILLRETSTSGDIFEYNLGNIPPKQKIHLQICLVSELSCEADGAVKFYMPFVLNPRYGIIPKDEHYQKAPKPREFSFNATIKWKSQIKDVKSEQPMKMEYQENKCHATVRLTEKFNFEKDILFLVYYDEVEKPQVIMEKGDGNARGMLSKDIMMINLFPKLPQVKAPQLNDYIFIIDHSGSMNGEKIEAAKDTLLLFLKSLPLGCSFNLISFNNYLEVLFKDGSREYNEDSLNEALKFHNNLYAAGGTEMLSAIKSLSDKRSSHGLYRQVFLITDGEVYNTNEIIQSVKSQAYNTRYFTIGVGSGVSTELVKGIARAGRGRAEFVMTNDNLKAKVMRLLKLSMQPFVSSVRISAKDAESNKELSYITVPENIPCIFTEESLIVYLVFQKLESTCQRVRLNLSGKVGESDFSLDFETNVLNQCDKEMQIHRLCVRRKIQELELKEDLGKGDNIKSEIIDLATLANLVSRYTSFIGAEKSYKVSVTARETMSKKFDAEKFQELRKIDNTKFNFESKDRLKSLLLLQNFSGYWELNEFLATVLKESLDQLKQRKPSVHDNVWATALAVVFLTEKLTSQKSEWDLIVDKAIRWLKLQNTQAISLDQIMTESSRILKTKIYS
ncbi:von Willebrand factor A domain-containing protein 5A [Octopus bimaculoides]|uniref:VWFA domain-containing protein n=1 Tax=Octopus bimaculoides TaxID=37653 RepID=A0A0L8GT62_OCTBM|nr:von Willebrand factor A domain-containing protein 5A [Octopus bimaculoides]|eukprot:XP_014778507.1 PREDICTED: von Willebrand factor A domain-containing protein 5A-like [Octopus bimaculoides]